jgi:hypothetical protein
VEVEIKDNGCETCDGVGMIGGPSYYAPDEGGVPCPDCTPTGAVLALAAPASEPVAWAHPVFVKNAAAQPGDGMLVKHHRFENFTVPLYLAAPAVQAEPVAWWRISYVDDQGNSDAEVQIGKNKPTEQILRDNGFPWQPLYGEPLALPAQSADAVDAAIRSIQEAAHKYGNALATSAMDTKTLRAELTCVIRATLQSAAHPAVEPMTRPLCRDCADFGPICPNTGKPCSAAHPEGGDA